MHILQQKILLHSDASMFMESSNTKFHGILHNNGKVRSHAQCHSKLHFLKTKTSLCSNLQNFTFLLSKHFVINKNVSVDVFKRLLTNNE